MSTTMADAMLKHSGTTPKQNEKENESVKRPAKKPTTVGKESQPSVSGTQVVKGDTARDAATALKTYNTEVLTVLKELSSNQNKINDKIEKLSSRVDSLYDNQDYEYYDDEFQSENFVVDCADSPAHSFAESTECSPSEPPSKKTEN